MRMDKGMGMSGMTRQRGMTALATAMILIIIGFVALVGMRVIPIYIDYFAVRSTLEGLKQEPGVKQMSRIDILNRIQKRFDVGYVTIVQAKDIKVRQEERNTVLELVYDDRRALLGNLDVVAKFNETILLPR